MSVEQKEHRRQVSQKLKILAKKDQHLLNKVVTEWVSQKQRHNHRNGRIQVHHDRKKAHHSRLKVNSMMLIFFDSTDIVLFEYARREKESIRNSIKVFLIVCAKMSEIQGLHSGET